MGSWSFLTSHARAMQLIAKHWDEPTLYRAAHAFEASVDWQTLGPPSR